MVMIPATTGIDQNEDKLRLPPGTLRDCLNYEVAYRSGYSSLEGMIRYDGRDLGDDVDAYRNLVQVAPGGPAYGLHFFSDRASDRSWLYAVVQSTRVALGSRGYASSNLQVEGQRAELFTTTPTGFPNAWVLESNASFAGETRDLIEVLIDPGLDVFSGDIKAYTRVTYKTGPELPAVGDQLTDAVSGWIATVRGVTQLGGLALTSTIEAELWVEIDTAGSMAVGATLERVSDDQLIGQLTETSGYSENGVFAGEDISVISDFGGEVDRGVLIRADKRGWQVVQQAYEGRLVNGTTEPSNVYSNGSQVALGADPTPLPSQPATAASWNEEGGIDWNLDDAALRDAIQSDDTSFALATLAEDGDRTERIRLSNFKTSLDELDEVTGVEFQVIVERASGSMDLTVVGMQSQTGAIRGAGAAFTAKETLTFGGPTDLWGASGVNQLRQNVTNASYEYFLRFAAAGTDADTELRLYAVRRIVYLREGSLESVVYLRSGGVDYQARALYANRLEGEWADGDAEGFITLGRIQNPALIGANAQIRTQTGGGGDYIGRIDGSLTPIRLPSRARLAQKKSKFQFLDSNFFASGRLAAVYGVSGAGTAFTFNNNYLFKIRTGRAEDEPRHVARHKDRLVLGYENGDADFSVATQPDLFDGILNAFTQGFGQRITGMLPLDGETLGVWTENSIWGVQGTTIDDVIQQIIEPTTGAIEYTVLDMGMPVFLDFRGISTIQASSTYGDFDGGRLSAAVKTWLRPRLEGRQGSGIRPILAEAVPKKSQYRIWFEDGFVLTMTWLEDRVPRWTFQRYWVEDDETPVTMVATTHGVDENNRPLSFASFEETENVMLLHEGQDFDGETIRRRLVFNPVHANGAGKNIRVNSIHIHGVCNGLVELSLKVGVDYKLPELNSYNAIAFMGNANQTTEEPVFTKFRYKARGKDFALQVETQTNNRHTVQVLEYPNLSERKLER